MVKLRRIIIRLRISSTTQTERDDRREKLLCGVNAGRRGVLSPPMTITSSITRFGNPNWRIGLVAWSLPTSGSAPAPCSFSKRRMLPLPDQMSGTQPTRQDVRDARHRNCAGERIAAREAIAGLVFEPIYSPDGGLDIS
jgi:hypothetical protein